jgi:CRISPR-associated protein (TIGR03986 family)
MIMSNVKSTYNFVPAPIETEVFKPSWANLVSHDIPFEDGESGEIEFVIRAETPIFIRNGYSKNNETNEFSHYFDANGNKQYFIPASSLKGMIRSVLEIMSFSRMNKNLVNDNRYSYRDLSSATNQYMSNYKKFDINGGWLTEKADGSWAIEECEDLAFINHRELKEKKNVPFRDLFLGKNPEDKTAESKYKRVPKENLIGKFSTEVITLFGGVKRNNAIYDANGKKGTLVFTGQSSRRNEPEPPRKANGKINEFVFFDSETLKDPLVINEKMQKDFKFIYYNDDKNNISPDWRYWRNNFLEKGQRVPVFYSKDANGHLNHFGLAYMYKLPYKNSVAELEPMKSYKESLDLATTLFGFTEKSNGLKGRVMCGNAVQIGDVTVLKEVKEILGGPKASYFPFYLNQFKAEKKSYFTYDDQNATLKGFKRYPVHHDGVKTGDYDSKQLQNQKVFSTFRPLASETEFTTKIRFHNLKPIEIGALLSAMTFHGNQDKCYHNIGAAKSFGYGKLSVMINKLCFLNQSAEDYMSLFEEEMERNVEGWWKKKALTELFAMASNTNDFTLEYPTIENFVEYKKTKDNDRSPKEIESLDYYSEILGERFKRNSFKSVASKNQTQDALNFDVFENIDVLRIEIERLLSESYDEFSDENKSIISDKLKHLYTNHKLSKKKMDKENTWILFWNNILGIELSNNVRSELNILNV